MQDVVRQAYEFSLEAVGQDITAGGLWQVRSFCLNFGSEQKCLKNKM